MRFADLKTSLFINKKTGEIVRAHKNTSDGVLRLNSPKVSVKKDEYIARKMNGEYFVLNANSFEREYEPLDQKFGWFEWTDIYKTKFWLRVVLKNLLAIQQKNNSLHFIFTDGTDIMLHFRDENEAKASLNSFFDVVAVMKKWEVLR